MVKIFINRSVGEKTSMSEEQAAEKIQASFRGYKTRKTLANNNAPPAYNQSDEDVEEKIEDVAEDPEDKSTTEVSIDSDAVEDIDLNDEELVRAATVIQNSYRNYMLRKQLQNAVEANESEDGEDKGEEVDINLNDAELGWAAAVIQLSYKSYLDKKKQENEETETPQDDGGNEEEQAVDEEVNNEENIMGIDLDDPELQSAAVKIQSAFRGYRVRKALKSGQIYAVEDEKDENEDE